jgi:hypothetical protein
MDAVMWLRFPSPTCGDQKIISGLVFIQRVGEESTKNQDEPALSWVSPLILAGFSAKLYLSTH